MAKNRNIRALVLLNPIGFFYDKGHPKGVMYEALEEFQKFANQKLKTGTLDVKVTFLPMRPDQIEAALTEGVGDMIAYGIVVTPERETASCVLDADPDGRIADHRNRARISARSPPSPTWAEKRCTSTR